MKKIQQAAVSVTTTSLPPVGEVAAFSAMLIVARGHFKNAITYSAACALILNLLMVPPVVQAEPFSEYDLLLLDFTLERERLAQSVTAYTVNDVIVVSLAEAAAALEFPIVVDAANGTANGWFLNKERHFALDTNAGTVTVDGATAPLAPNDAIAHEGAIYVPLAAFSRWFPANLTPDITTLSIKVAPREILPVQKRAERRKTVGTRFIMAPALLPEIEMPYQLLGPHTADVGLGYSIYRKLGTESSAPRTSLSHSMLIRGEFAYMNSAIYLGGNDTKSVSNARLTLSRDQPDTPTGINRIELGDTTPAVVSGAPQADIERGILIRGSTFQDADIYNLDGTKTRISGNVLPGWEVELQHNGIRVDYQIIGAEGRYDFHDLELYSGTNNFDLIFYGPSGERRTETITRYAGTDTIRKGNLSYQLTASQKGRTLYETESDPINNMSDRGSGRYTARLDYGLFSNLSLRGGWNSVVENGERLDYLSTGFRTGWRDLYMTLDATQDPLGGTIWDGTIHTPVTMRLWGFNTQFQHTQYASSIIAKDNSTDLQVTNRSSIVLTRSTHKLSSRFAATHSQLSTGSTMNYSADLSTNRGAHRIGNTLNYQSFDNSNNTNQPTQLIGNLYFSSNLNPIDVRGNIYYQLQPENSVLQYQLKSNLSVAQDMGMYFELDYTPSTELTLYTAGLNWQLKYITLAPRLSYDSDSTYTGFIYASISLSPKPDRMGVLVSGQSMANNGGVAGRVFVDHDNNGIFNANDTPIPGAEIYAAQAFRQATTDEGGTAYLTALRPGKATDVRLDQATLPGISMTSPHAGNSVQPRPARWAVIDFPIIPTGEIDGTLYQNRNGNLIPQPGMMVELRNANNEVIAFNISGRDGFFFFEQIPLGAYTVTLSDDTRDRLTTPPAQVKLSQETSTQKGVELVVSAQKITRATLFPTQERAAIAPAIEPTAPPQATVFGSDTVDANPTPPAQTVTAPYMLQLGAFNSQAKAETAKAELRQRYTKLLQGLDIQIERIDLSAKGVLYRVYARGNLDANEAKARCRQLGQLGQNCLTIPHEDAIRP